MTRDQVLAVNAAVKSHAMSPAEGMKQLANIIAKDSEDMYVMVLKLDIPQTETARTLADIHRKLDLAVQASAEFSTEIASVVLSLMTCIRTGPDMTDALMKAVCKFMEDRDARILQPGE